MIPTATLDTNVLEEYWREQKNAAVTASLLELAVRGQVDLAITSRISEDMPDLPLANLINDLPELNIQQIGSVFRFDYSAFDGGDMFGSDIFLDVISTIDDKFNRQGRRRKRPDWRDWDHLHGHYLSGREVFLTWDRPILEVASELKEQLGIVVITPQEFLSSQSELTRNNQEILSTEPISDRPPSPG